MEMTFRPIVQWPGKMTAARRRSQFKASYPDTLGLLDRELENLHAKNVVLQVALSPDQIRLDGRPRADSRPSHPGIILTFHSKHGPLSYPCDTFERWEDNLRAIALSLEYLRAVDRYGVTRRGEQYTGWAALPPPSAGFASKEAAAEWMFSLRANDETGRHPAHVIVNSDYRQTLHRVLALRFHPDRGGDEATFKKLQQAMEVLSA